MDDTDRYGSERIKSILALIDSEIDVENNIRILSDFEPDEVIALIDNISKPVQLLNRLSTYNYNLQLYDKIIPYLKRAIELDDKDQDSLYNLGVILFESGEKELALKYLNQIKIKDPNIDSLITQIEDQLKPKPVKKEETLYRIDPSCDIRGIDRMKLGSGVVIQKDCWLNVAFNNPRNRYIIEIGESSNVGRRATISGANKIIIGKSVLIAPNVLISDHGHKYTEVGVPIMDQGITTAVGEIYIGDGTWIGTNSVIIGTLKIGKGCVIGANSVVNKDVPEYCVAVGNPARVVKAFDVVTGKWVKIKNKNHLEKILTARKDLFQSHCAL